MSEREFKELGDGPGCINLLLSKIPQGEPKNPERGEVNLQILQITAGLILAAYALSQTGNGSTTVGGDVVSELDKNIKEKCVPAAELGINVEIVPAGENTHNLKINGETINGILNTNSEVENRIPTENGDLAINSEGTVFVCATYKEK